MSCFESLLPKTFEIVKMSTMIATEMIGKQGGKIEKAGVLAIYGTIKHYFHKRQ